LDIGCLFTLIFSQFRNSGIAGILPGRRLSCWNDEEEHADIPLGVGGELMHRSERGKGAMGAVEKEGK
jgi:hypothetical protein